MFFRILCTALLVSLLVHQDVDAQPVLPNFSVTRLSEDKVLIQWKNPDTSLRQLSIQQSKDSLRGFQTLLTMPDPTPPENGTIINRPGAGKLFYRLYLMYPKGKFVFSIVRSPIPVPPPSLKPVELIELPNKEPIASTVQKPAPYKPGSSAIGTVPPIEHLVKPDSVARTRPELSPLPKLTPGTGIEVKKETALPTEPDQYIPSLTVYTHRDGYVFIQLPPECNLSSTQIRFFNDNRQALFELTHPPLRSFRIDKTNFYRSGWYWFEIWQKGKMTEANRFYLPLEY